MKHLFGVFLPLIAVAVLVTSCSTSQRTGDADGIEDAIMSKKSGINACYEKGQSRTGPKGMGQVVVNIVIGMDGKVAFAMVKSSSLKQPKVENCILKVLSTARFPSPKGGGTANVIYPFNFPMENQ